MTSDEVIVFADSYEEDRDVLGDDETKPHKAARVPIALLKANLDSLLANLSTLLPATSNTPSGGLRLEEFEVGVAVNGKGEVGFLGTGVEVGGEATIRLLFKRS